MPAANKPFEVFAGEQAECEQYAQEQVSGQVETANRRSISAVVVGTVLGAGLGAAIGKSVGAAIGAGSGAILGTGAGAGRSQWDSAAIQQRCDVAYAQCMYSKGNQVPGFAAQALPPPSPPRPPPAQP
jgi:hypothetical protein